jgi:ferric-dicitrate binding protein FerR (iron transport regulator)
LVSITFLIKKDKVQEDVPVITNNNTIKIGTDKATLTLEDGTIVSLEKGQQYNSDNLESNGEELVYKVQNTLKHEISYNYLTIPRGGQYHIILSDGTEVWLNSESQIKYPVAFPKGKTRQVELVYGEAYFDVSPSTNHNGTKFKVLTESQEIEVLGTEFNIKAYKDESYIYTTLAEGIVTVDNASRTQILKPSEQAILNKDNKNLTISKVDVNSETAWKKGLFSFKDKSLMDIMKVLSRWYDVDIYFEDESLKDVHFKGVLSKDKNIEEILILIKNTNYINAYEINNSTIIIKK